MLITTIPSFFGKSVKTWDNQEVTFDSKGHTTVEESYGRELVERYPTFMFNGENIQATEKTVQQEVTQELVNNLNAEILNLNEKLALSKEETKIAEADVLAWKELVESSRERAENAEAIADEEKRTRESAVQTLEFKISLLTSTSDQLKKLCEASGYDSKEWSQLSKEKLIEYILTKV